MRAVYLCNVIVVAALGMSAEAGSRTSPFTIEEIEDIARSVHPSLAAAEAGVAQAQEILRQARAYPNPTVAVTVGRGRPRDGGASRSEASIEWVQPIELPGIRKWRARVASVGTRGAEIERTVAKAVVDATVTRLAHAMLGEQRRLEIARESVEVAQRLHQILERRVELGESSPMEAVKARAEWFARRKHALDVKSALATARSALDAFCGHRLGPEYRLAEPPPAEPVALPDGLPDRLRAANPLVRRLRLAIERSAADVELERRSRLAHFDFVASHDTELDRKATTLGVGVTVPLWNRNRGAVAAAAANRERVAGELDALIVDLDVELTGAMTEYERARGAIRLHDEGWTATTAEALRIATFSFDNGETSLLDVLDAQRADLEVRLAEAESRAALNQARADIERLLGAPLVPENPDEIR